MVSQSRSRANSVIREAGTGALYVGGDTVYLYGSTNGETMVRGFSNGAVELYYDNSKKLETISGGITVTGGINTTNASTFNQSTFNSGAGAVTIAAHSDIRFNSGSWTGDSTKIQQHNNQLYIQGGSGTYGIMFRDHAGPNRWSILDSGPFRS